ncbi:MAG: hypothetical protein WA294_03665 [Acidobacteriaceae bacterium]
MPLTSSPSRLSSRLLVTGVLAILTAAASVWLMRSSTAVACGALAPLTVLATLSAFLISVCFRQMGRCPSRRSRWFLAVCLLIAAATLFADFRYVRRYRGFCDNLRGIIRQGPPAR